ncbi:hypothetical protein PTTG_09398 [Puccinia triticina 1-1 BBBD Race 1]|uniref:WH2 domain-containing protein n=1 Tax=Puccinia triticina (isolate 1-1 / race 1 (BBBD)) TaxID=630390 RepID=A0A180GG68_PUCT1|nr:hypothetical protein PTTG_09398 [Puccinia triticina 1-1 BBBD Race 1]
MDGALAAQIQAGRRLKKAQTNDRSAPIVAGSPAGAGAGGARPGGGLASAPRPPGMKSTTGAPKPPQHAKTDSQSSAAAGMTNGPPQLGGLFAGGMPTLRKTSGPASTPSFKAAPPVPKPATAGPPSRAPPPAPSMIGSNQPSSRPPPPVPPQLPNPTRPPPPPPAPAPSTSSRPPPPPPVPPQSSTSTRTIPSQPTPNAPFTPNIIPSQNNLRPTKSLAAMVAQDARQPPPPPARTQTQTSPVNSLVRTSSIGHPPRNPPPRPAATFTPPPPPPRPHTVNSVQPPPLPSRPGARAAPPPPPPRTSTNSPSLSGSLSRKAPPPPPRPSGLSASTNSFTSDLPSIVRPASTPPRRPGPPPPPPPPPVQPANKFNESQPSPPARLHPPPARPPPGLFAPSSTARPKSFAAPAHLPPPPPASSHHASRSSTLLDSRPRGLSTPPAPDNLGVATPRANGTARLRPQSMVVSGTLAPASNRPPSPPPAFSLNPPRNFPQSASFPAPRTFQPGITHQYPSTKKRGCEWDYRAVLV